MSSNLFLIYEVWWDGDDGDDELGIGGFVKGNHHHSHASLRFFRSPWLSSPYTKYFAIIMCFWFVSQTKYVYTMFFSRSSCVSTTFVAACKESWLSKWEQLPMWSFPTLKLIQPSIFISCRYSLSTRTRHLKEKNNFIPSYLIYFISHFSCNIHNNIHNGDNNNNHKAPQSTGLYCPSLGVSFAATSNIFLHGSTPRNTRALEQLVSPISNVKMVETVASFRVIFCRT